MSSRLAIWVAPMPCPKSAFTSAGLCPRRWLAPLVSTLGFRLGNSFSLALQHHLSLEANYYIAPMIAKINCPVAVLMSMPSPRI
jgi:hypothetical protein